MLVFFFSPTERGTAAVLPAGGRITWVGASRRKTRPRLEADSDGGRCKQAPGPSLGGDGLRRRGGRDGTGPALGFSLGGD